MDESYWNNNSLQLGLISWSNKGIAEFYNSINTVVFFPNFLLSRILMLEIWSKSRFETFVEMFDKNFFEILQ